MSQFLTNSEKNTKELAKKLALSKKFKVIGLIGDLGAGKTTFVQGMALGLGIKDKINSPTFVLVRQHKLPKDSGVFFHIDLYRLEGDIDIKQLGFEDMWSNPKNIVVVEWAEKIEKYLPKETILIYLEKLGDKKRRIEIKAPLLSLSPKAQPSVLR